MTAESMINFREIVQLVVLFDALNKFDAEPCSDINDVKSLTKTPYLLQSNVGTCSDVTDYMPYLMSLLDTCVFTSVVGATHYATCHAKCVTDDACIALTFSSNNGCEHCIETVGSGNGNSYAQADVMVAAEALKTYINGDTNSWNLRL